MLVIVGVKLILDGLWSLDNKDTAQDALYYSNDLGVWGWIWLISGIIILAAGIGLFYKRGWAWFIGILAGVYGVIVNLFWLFAQPTSALVGVVLSSLVIYGLTRYDENELEY
jgi:hypothetical protein